MKKTVVITGVSAGIGTCIAKFFANDKYNVVGLDKVEPQHNYCDKFLAVNLEKLVSDERFWEEFSKELINEIPTIDTLVNNAALQILGSLHEMKISDWRKTMDINLNAPLLLSKLFANQLELRNGSIINISSIHANITKPRFISYATSKAALIGLTQALAVDLGGRIRVNSISPAAIETTMLKEGFKNNQKGYDQLKSFHPIKRIGKPEEVAELCLFLASKKSKFITGANFEIDGGISKRLHDPD